MGKIVNPLTLLDLYSLTPLKIKCTAQIPTTTESDRHQKRSSYQD